MRDILEVLLRLFIAHSSQTLLELINFNAHEQRLELLLLFTLLRGILRIAKAVKVTIILLHLIVIPCLLIVFIGGLDE